jgi:hypothetical protein
MKIFLSYASEDKHLVEPIYYALVEKHTVFFDRKSLPPGGNFDTQISKAIQDSDLFIYCISPNAVACGSYTLSEVKFAEKKWTHPKKHILPVMLLETSYAEIPSYIKAVTVLETTGNIAAEVAESVRGMGRKDLFKKLIWGVLALIAVVAAVFIVSNISSWFSEPTFDAPEISIFEARPSVITQGEQSVLVWSTSNASQVEVSNFGIVPHSDQRPVAPSTTTGYRIIAKNEAGLVVEKIITLQVKRKSVGDGSSSNQQTAAQDIGDKKPERHASQTMNGGTGYIFSTGRITQGMGVDRDIWWNSREFVPGKRMYSLGQISNVLDIAQIASGHFKFKAFEPELQEGYAVEIKRNQETTYAIIQVISIAEDRSITFEWRYPYDGQVTGKR